MTATANHHSTGTPHATTGAPGAKSWVPAADTKTDGAGTAGAAAPAVVPAAKTRPGMLATEGRPLVRPPAAAHLSDAQVAEIGRELDTIRDAVLAKRGAADAAYIRRMIRVQRVLEVGGRAALLGSRNKVAWVAGTTMLSFAKILENMEIGHNVLHGQWDWMRDPDIHSSTWEWDFVTPSRSCSTPTTTCTTAGPTWWARTTTSATTCCAWIRPSRGSPETWKPALQRDPGPVVRVGNRDLRPGT